MKKLKNFGMTKLMGPNCGIECVYTPDGRKLHTIHTQHASTTKIKNARNHKVAH